MELHRLLAKLMFTIPAVALGMWSPSLVGAAKLSAQVQDGYRTLASQWQSFVGRRLREDFAFMQRTICRPVRRIKSGAHAEFWQTAIEDYSNEYLLISKLAARLTSVSVSRATKEASDVFLCPG